MAAFADYGFESFEEKESNFSAYIPQVNFNKDTFKELDIFRNPEIKIEYEFKTIQSQNWNALWESNFEPVVIEDICYIRAPFHPAKKGMTYEIIIEPKMSFGTGHHETTTMMVKLLLEQNIADKNVLDVGCGTALLAILACKIGAAHITAIDNEEWAFQNAKENILHNNTSQIEVLYGNISMLLNRHYDFILANINRNVLLDEIPSYSNCLDTNGLIILSGFYETDLGIINKKASQFALKFLRYINTNNWCASVYKKE
jgi:ribosomal protein L11 methyltransferase